MTITDMLNFVASQLIRLFRALWYGAGYAVIAAVVIVAVTVVREALTMGWEGLAAIAVLAVAAGAWLTVGAFLISVFSSVFSQDDDH